MIDDLADIMSCKVEKFPTIYWYSCSVVVSIDVSVWKYISSLSLKNSVKHETGGRKWVQDWRIYCVYSEINVGY